MTAITFDTFKFANRLKAAGIPDKHAEAIAEAQAQVQENAQVELATKNDIKELAQEIKALELRMNAKMSELKIRLLKWMITMLAGQGTLVVLAIKMLGH